jgi:hypothetical protein
MADGEVVIFSYSAVAGLIRIADEFWHEIDGACARTGFDPLGLPFDRFLNLIYSWACERVQFSENGRTELDEALFGEDERRSGTEPDNVAPRVVEEEMALFQAFSAEHSQLSRGVS